METPLARTALSGPRQVEWDVADRHEPADAALGDVVFRALCVGSKSGAAGAAWLAARRA